MKLRLSITLALLACCGAFATAAPKASPEEVANYQRKLFQYMDHDGDGKLTQREFVVIALYTCFEDQKPDRKGRLSKKQFIKTFNEETDAESEWAMMDTDQDGFITFEDVFKNKPAVRDMENEFSEIDPKGKGYVTLAEVIELKP